MTDDIRRVSAAIGGATREKAKNVAKRSSREQERGQEREWMHWQGCGLCGCPCAAAAPLLSDARGALRTETQLRFPPPSLSAEFELCRRPAKSALVLKTTPAPSTKTFPDPFDGDYVLECFPQPDIVVLRHRPQDQILAKIVIVNVFVDRVLARLLNSRFVSDCGREFGNVNARKVCDYILRRLSVKSNPAKARRRPSLLQSQRPTNEPLEAKDTDLKTQEPRLGCDIRGSELPGPRQDHVCDSDPTFNFVENPILSDSFKSFVLNCVNDEKPPICDQLFLQLLFYLNVIGLNLISLLGDFVQKRDDAILLKLSKEHTRYSNFNQTSNLCCCHLTPESSTNSPSEKDGTVSAQEKGCYDSKESSLKSPCFTVDEKTQLVSPQIQVNSSAGLELGREDTRLLTPSPPLINLSCNKVVDEGYEINQSSVKDLDFINDLIPCYEQYSRTDEHLRQQIDDQPYFVEPSPVENSLPERPKSILGFNYDDEFESSQFEPNYESNCFNDAGAREAYRGDDTKTIEDQPVDYLHQNLLNDYMNIMKQKASIEETVDDNAASVEPSKPLKSALKKTPTKGFKTGCRVKFDESLNKFFDADYVILVREDSEFDDRFGEVCECGDEFCDGRYYEDEESDDDFVISNCPHEDGCDGYGQDGRGGYRFRGRPAGYDFPSGSTFEPPLAFVDQDVTLSPPDGYKDGCCSHQFPEPGETVHDAHPGAHQNFERDQESINPIYSQNNKELKSSGSKGSLLQNNASLENSRSDNETNVGRSEQEKQDYVPETKTLKLSNLYNQGKLSPNSVERNLGLKLRTLNSNQSLKPNSAVRQLFPSSNFILPPQFAQKSPDLEDPSLGNSYATYVPNSSLFHTYTSVEDDDDDDGLLGNNLFRKTIEKNSLRRSLIRYPKDYRKRKCKGRNSENSLTERIKKLTCDIDDDENLNSNENKPVQEQLKPLVQETKEISRVQQTQTPPVIDEHLITKPEKVENGEKSIPATQTSSTSSTMSSTYRKLTDLFSRKSDKSESSSNTETRIPDQYPPYRPVYQTAPDLGNGLNISNKYPITKSSATDARKQFLSSLAPLTACVSGNFEPSSPHGHLSLNLSGNRNSFASVDSNVSSEYSLNDIDEALGRTRGEPTKLAPQPDVIAGTPAGNSDAGNNDELALFVQQDAGRIERIKNRYSTGSTNGDSDDDNDDYGFHRRPSVRGIKPRFGSTTEIIQQIQSQLQPPPALDPANIGSHMTWPYYTVEQKSFVTRDMSNTLITTDTGIAYTRNHQKKLMANCTEPDSEGISQPIPYTNRYTARSANVVYQQDLLTTSRDCPIYRNQRMVQMHLSPLPTSQQVRFSTPTPQFKHEVSSHYLVQTPQSAITSIIHVEQGQQQTIRVPYPASGPVQVHLQTSRRSESPVLQNQHSISVRSTQTAALPYYDPKPPSPYYNYGPLVYMDHPRTNIGNNNFINSNLGSPMSSVTSSPTRSKPETSLCAERGVPEGAASVPMNYQQDTLYAVPVPPMNQETVITLTPTSQPNSSVYYAMNV